MLKKIILLVVLAAIVACYFIFDLGQYLNLEYLQTQKDQIATAYQQNKVLFLVSFFLIYVISVAVSIPGATILTLTAGFLFGSLTGTILVSFASSIGATLAMIFARVILGETLQKKYQKQLATINQGVEKDGVIYLLSLRLIPLFPFFLINLLMGLTKMSVARFYLFTQLGALPGTFVYVNAGTALSKINKLGDIVSLEIFLSFAALGILPLLIKFIVMPLINKIRKK